ncbi:hypothetical protein FRX31_007453 [Thalictrum thalictroides]|uniref:Uncharacterized protein n=1 Tax=Thalictrum thalictroides TaxID=46969 RepID=A0A7J6X3L6_THATH|nr:hypothetical protein FRX31_007453 [Thalictrum thalictroides]
MVVSWYETKYNKRKGGLVSDNFMLKFLPELTKHLKLYLKLAGKVTLRIEEAKHQRSQLYDLASWAGHGDGYKDQGISQAYI